MKFDHLVRSGQVKDYAELPRLGHVTRATHEPDHVPAEPRPGHSGGDPVPA